MTVDFSAIHFSAENQTDRFRFFSCKPHGIINQILRHQNGFSDNISERSDRRWMPWMKGLSNRSSAAFFQRRKNSSPVPQRFLSAIRSSAKGTCSCCRPARTLNTMYTLRQAASWSKNSCPNRHFTRYPATARQSSKNCWSTWSPTAISIILTREVN